MFNPDKQFRCAIIRGKAKNDLDNLLPNYASVISEICPCSEKDFATNFNKKIATVVGNATKKTLDNHRTEIAGKLFGLFYINDDGMVYASERTLFLIEKSDQPAFFKDICFKFQFPNGMDSLSTLEEKLKNKISIRQFPYIIKLLVLSEKAGANLTKDEVGYYVLNCLEVLQGCIKPEDVLKIILERRKDEIYKKVEVANKPSSYSRQHINEQISLLELANLIRVNDGIITLNSLESDTITIFERYWNEKPEFDVYAYDLSSLEERKKMYFDWGIFFGKISKYTDKFETSLESLSFSSEEREVMPDILRRADMTQLGDDGEIFVFNYEKERVAKYDKRLTNKVLLLGKTKGLGFDIQSIIAEHGEDAEYVKYIEVKSTKRMTVPSLENKEWADTLTITRNEWIAAMQHKEAYYIYRVYFTPELITVFIIHDPHVKSENRKLKIVPTHYRLDFNHEAVDFKIEQYV